MGNMMDNLFMRSFTTKANNHTPDVSQPSSPSKVGIAPIVLIIAMHVVMCHSITEYSWQYILQGLVSKRIMVLLQ